MRNYLSNLCFYLSSLFLFIGKFILSKNKHIPITILPIPGWYINFKDIVHNTPLPKRYRSTKGFELTLYRMPKEYIDDIDKYIITLKDLKKDAVEAIKDLYKER